ncbi:MAG: RNA polymerase sigma 28 subunit SigD/FliA/WhiG [Candidatus Saganbacteria bacterium]|uniref:RNA polymerase sigma 28 subunit SigD/FliA/WhiG n=1 Tax=Candidatus Saganbacteria bacterium TaxID=2575572 RepID=A0A833L0B9_UNCSA|nr:MAG: RNA polymerase sigma 28 subunit SigD/FliA/WhiG [Candidatus Saganbacteria bacterium]
MALKKKKTKIFKKMPKSLEAYMPLVHSIASMVSGKGLPPNIDYNDLVSDGTIGMMKAWDNFDPNRGVKFETYASYRVRGEILDGLKSYSPVPYRVQVMIRDLAKKGYKASVAERMIKEEKELEKKELSEGEFKTAVEKIKKIISASALMYMMSLEEVASRTEMTVSTERGPVDEVEFNELKEKLSLGMKKLPVLFQKVLHLFFQKGLNQKTIATMLKLSRPKVCRVIDKSVRKLQRELKNA